MLRASFRAAQAALLALPVYDLLTALPGWSTPPPAPAGGRRRPFRVVVPAHDEAAVIGTLLDDLSGQDYPAAQAEVVVLADRCSDATASVARARGARVVERVQGPAGKGAALAWYLDREPLDGAALVVLDADNRAPRDLLARFADELDAGHHVLQSYLDVTNPDGSALATASALTYWASNRMVQLSRRNLGWSADLGGTGMCLTAAALDAAGGFTTSPTEDQELTARLVLAGERAHWLHHVRVRDEKPEGLAPAVRQRARWMAGKREVARRYGGRLVATAWRRRSFEAADVALRLARPGRSFVALVCGLAALGAATTRSRWLLPWPVWLAATGVQVLAPVPFLARDGIPARYLLRYPLVAVVGALWVPVRLLSGRVRGWYHTPHGPRPHDHSRRADPPSIA